MVFDSETKELCKKTINKACKKNPVLRKVLESKMGEILQNPSRYKHLGYGLAGESRVHILKSFVLVFEISYSERKVVFLRFGHHDEAYRRK